MIELVAQPWMPAYPLLEQRLADAGLVTGVEFGGDRGTALTLHDLEETDRAAAQTVLDDWTAEVEANQATATTTTTNKTTLRDRAGAALAANTAWRANTYPQVVAGADAILGNATATAREKNLAQGVKTLANQVEALCAQNNALIRLLLDDYTSTE